MTPPVTDDDAIAYCLAQVRREDRDRYVTALLAPARARDALFALYAFNLEVAKTRETVSEALLGEIRLQWWRETIDGLYDGTPRQHQVVTALGQAIRRHDLPRAPFIALIEARARDLDDSPFADLAALERYAEATTANLQHLALAAVGDPGEAARSAARDVGIGWALTGLVRALPFHAGQRRHHLPADLLAATGVPDEDVYRRRFTPAMGTVVEAVVAAARARLATARECKRDIPRPARRTLLLAALGDAYADRIARAGFDPFAADLRIGELGRPLRLLWRAWLGAY